MTNGSAIRQLNLGGHVGFDSLPDQLVNQAVTSGFTFNIMCVGETGLGKSTLMDSLFNTNFESNPQNHREPNVRLDSHTFELEESNVKLKLTICDTVGYGDQVNKQDSFKPIVDYIDEQFEAYLQEELKIKRNLSTYHDSRYVLALRWFNKSSCNWKYTLKLTANMSSLIKYFCKYISAIF